MRRCSHRPGGLLRGWAQARPGAHGNLSDRTRECSQVSRPCQRSNHDRRGRNAVSLGADHESRRDASASLWGHGYLCERPALPRDRPSMAAHATAVKPIRHVTPKKSVNLSIEFCGGRGLASRPEAKPPPPPPTLKMILRSSCGEATTASTSTGCSPITSGPAGDSSPAAGQPPQPPRLPTFKVISPLSYAEKITSSTSTFFRQAPSKPRHNPGTGSAPY
jgi:hypothetical protein